MDTLEVLLAPEILSGILIVGSLAIAVRSLLHFSKEASALRPKLESVDKELNKLRDGIVPKRKVVSELGKEVSPIREKEQRLAGYGQQLRELEIEAEKKELETQEEAESEKRRRVQRKRMGFGSND